MRRMFLGATSAPATGFVVSLAIGLAAAGPGRAAVVSAEAFVRGSGFDPPGTQNFQHVNDPTSAYASAAGYEGTAQASANLATGKLRAESIRACDTCIGDAKATLDDKLTFHLPNGVDSADVRFSYAIDGFFQALGGFDQSTGIEQMNFSMTLFQNEAPGISSGTVLGLSGVFAPGAPTEFTNFHVGQYNGVGPLRLDQTGAYGDVVLRNTTYSLTLTLGAFNGAQFFDTGTFSLPDLPQGVTFTSDSGVFLSQAGVPEPAAWTLMILGFGGAGAALRRRRLAAA